MDNLQKLDFFFSNYRVFSSPICKEQVPNFIKHLWEDCWLKILGDEPLTTAFKPWMIRNLSVTVTSVFPEGCWDEELWPLETRVSFLPLTTHTCVCELLRLVTLMGITHSCWKGEGTPHSTSFFKGRLLSTSCAFPGLVSPFQSHWLGTACFSGEQP